MALRKRPIAAGIAALLFSGYVSALGLGEIRLNSALNEPLDAEIPLLNLGELSETEIIAGLASQSDFQNAGVDRELILSGLLFNLDLDASGGPVLRVFSQKPIREPYLDFLVDVQWPAGRLLREYTLLLDLPVYAGGSFTKKKAKSPLVFESPRDATTTYSQPSANGDNLRSSPAVAGDQEYVVREGDTLWRIASNLPSTDSVRQRMAGIQQLNPDAFINGDINLLKKGAVLRLPASGVGSSAHSTSFQPQSQPTSTKPQLSGTSRQPSSSTASNSSGRLSLSASSETKGEGDALGSSGTGGSQLRGEIDAIQEELDRSRRENAELKQRLSSMEEQFATMQRLLELEDTDLRAAQLASAQRPLFDDSLLAEPQESLEEQESEDLEPEASPSLALFPSANVSVRNPAKQAQTSNAEELASGGIAPGSAQTQDTAEENIAATSNTIKTEAGAASLVTSPEKMELKTEKGWFEKVSGYLTYVLGLLVIVIGAIAFFVLRKGKKDSETNDYTDAFQNPAERFPPPPAHVRSEPVMAPQQPQASSLDEIDLKADDDLFADLEAEAPPQPKATYSQPSPPEAAEDVELDLSEFDLDDLGADEPERTTYATQETAADHLNLDEEFDFLGDIDEGDTQLELAQAYLEMGDNAGAREILMEVADGGSDEQKAKARELLQKIS